MPDHPACDETAKVQLLCYLVVGEIVAIVRTGECLRTDHLVESARIWMQATGVKCDWQDRLELAQLAAKLAPRALATFNLTSEGSIVELFSGGWTLDYRKPVVREINQFCANELVGR
ncbi:hypothetical protein [Paraburkholderia saeva]|uniref:hypothetical protein n=1 Tax=Paraburkholderia saeva TaxID=2777537 RepID=UPI001E04ADD2|nr:hypothetical protein [Paraburkholderia saeva]CAG4888073.1 hypothetical protein R52603_00571 [Paraburkholderia saeva]